MAQLEYQYQINLLNSKGIPFKEHLYVPEVHPITGVEFCEREDDGHVFKVFSLLILSNVIKDLSAHWAESQTRWSTSHTVGTI